jgi:hypothetical protein
VSARAIRLAQFPLFCTFVLIALLITLPGRSELALNVYWLVLAAFALAVLVGLVRQAHPVPKSSTFDLGLRRAPRTKRSLAELEQLEREVILATSTAFDVHLRFRPRLRRIAAYLLASRRGVDLDSNPERARQLLGEQTWELVRPERPAPTERHARGLLRAELREIVGTLERLAASEQRS